MRPERFKELTRAVPHRSVPWFDLLDKEGLLEAWCASERGEIHDYVLWLLSATEIIKSRGERVAGLIEPMVKRRGNVSQQLRRLFRLADFGSSPGLCRIFLDLIKEGAFDDDGQYWQGHLHGFAKAYPAVGAKIVGQAFDRALTLAKEKGVASPFDEQDGLLGMNLSAELVSDSAHCDPSAFSEELLPRIAQLISANEAVAKDGDILDTIWVFRVFGMPESFKDQVLTSTADALSLLAAQYPERLDRIVAPYQEMPHQNVAYLLLTGWSGNASIYADRIVDYLLADPRRLDIEYAMWDSGNGISAITRAALAAAGPHCSAGRLGRIEEIIRGYLPYSERGELKGRGYHEYLLLCALPRGRLSSASISRLQELERKFPNIEAGGPFISNSDGFVHSPIERESAERMSDDQWINAMRTHDSEEGSRRQRLDDFYVGGAHQLAGVLEHLARADKPRFAKLAERMDAGLQPAYFEALLRGLGASPERRAPGAPASTTPDSFLSDEEFEAFILRVYSLAGETVGRWICVAIQSRANHKLSPVLLQLLEGYAIGAPDPEADSWNKQGGAGPLYGGDALTEGINSTRGAAAHAIAASLFADRTRISQFRKAIETLVRDRSVSVRSVAVECLLAMLNFDRPLAVSLFLSAVDCDDAILRTHTVRSFVRYVVFSHYEQIQGLLNRMLNSSVNDVRKHAAQSIAVAAFNSALAGQDLQRVLAGDEYCRSGVASVDASNLSADDCREVSRGRLVKFFDDPSIVVRDSAAKVIRKMGAKLLVTENELLSAFIKSRSFMEHVSTLIYMLKETGEQLPEVVCRIGERAAQIHRDGQAEAQWWTHDVGALVLRLYDQTHDPALQKRCLDIIDQMIDYNFGNVDPGLHQAERD
jgi:hypothetical protein